MTSTESPRSTKATADECAAADGYGSIDSPIEADEEAHISDEVECEIQMDLQSRPSVETIPEFLSDLRRARGCL